MDIVKRLQGISMMQAMTWVTADKSKRLANIYSEAADEIERLRENAKQDAKFLSAYHRICQKHGIAPSSSELIEAMKETEE